MFFFSGSNSRSRNNNNDSGNILGLIILIVSVLSIIFAPLLAALTQAAISRKREWMADDSAIALTRNPSGLKSALEKLENAVTSPADASPNISHLWIASPVEGKIQTDASGGITYLRKGSAVKSMFDTHPPLQDRINHLANVLGDRSAGK
jgi:heat shock protein HtpX